MLHDTTCCNCGGDCVLDLEYMEDHHADPHKAPENERMWRCTKCEARFTNSIMEAIPEGARTKRRKTRFEKLQRVYYNMS